jgi:hypothetical protein
MKRNILMLLFLIFLQSCKNQNEELNKLKSENEILKSKIDQTPINSTKFVWTVIYYKVGDWSPERGFYNYKNQLYWSEVVEVNNFNENIKYKLQDELEKECRNRIALLESIQKRETFVFDSYKQASEFKFKTVNK